MVHHQCIPLDFPSEWKEALKGIRHGFAHTWEHCYAMHLTTGLRTYLYCFETGNVRIVCPIAERTFDEYIDIVKPYGFSGFVGNGDCAEFPNYWKEFARQRGYVCGYLGLNPVFENSTYFEQEEVYQYNDIYVLDLTPSYEELFANLDMNRKRQLKHWNTSLPNIVTERPAVTEFFLANYLEFVQRKDASPEYYFSRDTLAFLSSLDNVFVVGARNFGNLAAVSVFAYTADIGDFLFNVSLPEGRQYSVALLWWAVNHLKSLGVPFLNLGGGDRENDSLAEFKRRFGGKKLALRCLKQVYEPGIYEKLCRRANVDPGDMTGYFPAYRRP